MRGRRLRCLVPVLVAACAASPALAAPYLRYVFIGSAADRAAILTDGSLPVIGGGFGCGQYNQGVGSCTLRDPDQQCCAHDIRPPDFAGGFYDLSGHEITIEVSATRGTATFIEWLGVCRPAPRPCVPQPSAPWCQGGLDYRGPSIPQSPAFSCTLTLPADADVVVTTRWEGEPNPNLPECTQVQSLSGTCALAGTTTTTPSTTTTTIPFDQLPPFKQDAARQMQRELQQVLAPCLTAVLGTQVFLLPPLAVGAITGATMVAAATPLCAQHLATLAELYVVYHDPPDPEYVRLVRVAPAKRPAIDLPACTDLEQQDRRRCRRLQRLALRHVKAVGRTANVAAALATTGNRYAAALADGNAKAAKKQLRHAGRLSRRFEAATRGRARAGARLVAALRALGAAAALDAAQATQAVGVVLGELAAQGVPEAGARALLGAAATPGAVDVLAVLEQP